ncbi:hypothetical protein D3C72_2433090 [compost metagenome]
MPAPVVAHRALEGFGQQHQARHQLVNGQVGVRRARQRGVQVIDVGLVMLGVVDLHRAGIDVGFQGVIGIGQGRQRVGHGAFRQR